MAELKKVIGFGTLLLIVINSIMGTGIFFLPAVSAGIAGYSAIISWAIMALVAIYISLCFGELCSLFPTSGGVYDFCKQAFSKEFSFLVGWLTLVVGNVTIAMLIVGAIQYLLATNVKWIIILVSIIFLIVFNIFSYRGMKTSVVMLVTFSFITLGTLLSLIIPGLFRLDLSLFSGIMGAPMLPVLVSIFFISETFFGWESITFLAGEVKDGRKNVPKALFFGTVIICLISFLFVITAFSSIRLELFSVSSAPLSELGRIFFGDIGATILMLLVYLSILGSVAGWVISSPRLILSLAKDRLFLPQFAAIHPKFFTPYKAIIFQAVVSILIVLIGAGSYHKLLEVLIPLLLLVYSSVMLSLIILRIKMPNAKRYFKAPFGIVGASLVISFFGYLLVMWLLSAKNPLSSLLISLSLFLLGFPLYLLLELYYDPKMIRRTNNFLATLVLLTESISLPVKVRKEMLKLVGTLDGKKVLEFGCSVGTLTLFLARAVGIKGKVYASDISEKDLLIAKKRIDKLGLTNVELVHDIEHSVRVHPNVPKVDVVISVGSLGYIQNLKSVLTHMNERLKVGSKICFLDYDKFFDVIPNIEWLSSDARIKHLFRNSGFKVDIVRKRTILWEYIYIYGVKIRNI